MGALTIRERSSSWYRKAEWQARILRRHDWLRSAEACTQLATERARYRSHVHPYHSKDRDRILVHRVREIETAQTQRWLRRRAAGRHTEPSTIGTHMPDLPRAFTFVDKR